MGYIIFIVIIRNCGDFIIILTNIINNVRFFLIAINSVILLFLGLKFISSITV